MVPPEDEGQEVEFTCPSCGARTDEGQEQCGGCGAPLGELYTATYRPAPSSVSKVLAWALLILVVGLPLAALITYLMR